MISPGRPKVDLAIVMRLVSIGYHNETSNIKKALSVIMSQQKTKAKNDGPNPAAAVATGKANIPAPIQVPATNNAPPKILLIGAPAKWRSPFTNYKLKKENAL